MSIGPRRLLIAFVVVLALAASSCSLTGGGAGYDITAKFDRTFNLFTGSRVRIMGVAIGKVTDIDFRSGMDAVEVHMHLSRDIELPADVKAAVVPEALLGERYVDLSPAYTGGPTLDAGAEIPLSRTTVPAEFDEILESLDDFLDGLPPEEVGRLVTNAAEVLRGRGDELGATLEDVATAVEVLRANDDAVVRLSTRLADLNETLATRDAEIGRLIEDFSTVVDTLAAERDDLDAALSGVARLSTELGDLLGDHREDLQDDIESLTRVGRSADRNIDQLERGLHFQSELYRHARRVFDFENNWLPLVNHSEGINAILADRLRARLTRACNELGLDDCRSPSFWQEVVPGEVCLTPIATCPGDLARMRGEDPGTIDIPADQRPMPMREALRRAVEAVPELPERLAAHRGQQQQAPRETSRSDGGSRDTGGQPPIPTPRDSVQSGSTPSPRPPDPAPTIPSMPDGTLLEPR